MNNSASNKKWQTISKNHTAIYTGPTGCREIHLVLELIEKGYNKHFDYIIIICPTLRWNKTYHAKDWIRNHDRVWLLEPKNRLYQWAEKLSQLLSRLETLFIIDSIIADESLDKKGWSLLELAIWGTHHEHYLWLLKQSYSATLKDLRRHAKPIFAWYPKEKADLKMIYDE